MLAAALVATLLVWASLAERRHRRWKPTRAVVTAYVVLSLAALVAMDRMNVLVQYDRWLSRGMPERPCGDVTRHFWACQR
jgi:hypothetical protein